jgi:pilus assembly protein Flp/PilA
LGGETSDLRGPIFTEDLLDYPTLPAMIAKLRQFLADESGATAIEYGLIAAGISVAIIAVVNGLGTKLKTTFSSISTQLM